MGRVRHCARVRPLGFAQASPFLAHEALYRQATRRAVALGVFELTESNRLLCRLVLARRPRRGHRTRAGPRAHSRHAQKMTAPSRAVAARRLALAR